MSKRKPKTFKLDAATHLAAEVLEQHGDPVTPEAVKEIADEMRKELDGGEKTPEKT